MIVDNGLLTGGGNQLVGLFMGQYNKVGPITSITVITSGNVSDLEMYIIV